MTSAGPNTMSGGLGVEDTPSSVDGESPNARRRFFRSTVDNIGDFPQWVVKES